MERCAASRLSAARLRAVVLNADSPDAAARLEDAVRAIETAAEIFTLPFSPVMIAHTGPGVVGLAWWWDAPVTPQP